MPGLPRNFLPRPRLLAAPGLQTGAGVTLVCAPAGYGKSTLLAHWARAGDVPAAAIAWVNLDRGDDDPRRLWGGILAALRACPAVVPSSALHTLAAPTNRPGTRFLADVVDALDALPSPVSLVLHDLHELTDPATLAGLGVLVAARRPGAHVVLCSRLDPPFALGAPRAAGTPHDVRMDQLRFSPAESAAVVRGLDVGLVASQQEQLHTLTRGWPTGVRLAAGVLRGSADRPGFLARFEADDRPGADFLVDEALAALPADDRATLSAVAVGGSVPPGLAAALAERPDAAAVLDRIAADTDLVTQDARGHYVVDHLVAAHLGAEHQLTAPSAHDLHRRAARWWARETDPGTAIEHVVAAGDDALLVALVHHVAPTLLVHGEHPTLRRALTRLGPAAVAADPWLALCSALDRLESGDTARAREDLAHAAACSPADPDPRLAVLRSTAGIFAAAASVDLRAAPPTVSRAQIAGLAPEWQALALAGIGGRGLFTGADRAAAAVALADAIDLADRHGYRHLEMQCLTLTGGVAGLAGDYPGMSAAAGRALAAAAAGGRDRTFWATANHVMLACTALMRAEPARAGLHAGRALEGGSATLPRRFRYVLRAVQGAALFDGGHRHRGLQQMQQARAELGPAALSAELAALPAVLEHQASLALGHPSAASAVVDWLADRIGPRGEVLVMRAWAQLSAGRDTAARSTVGPLLDGRVAAVLPHTLVDALLVEASADVTAGDVATAGHALRHALSTGAPQNAVRPFATAEAPARELLDRHLVRAATAAAAAGSVAIVEFAARALAAGRHVDHRRTGHLDAADLGMLAQLPSARSVMQIAADLRIPLDDARARIRVIYRKLGVSSRRTAVSAAHERGLLS